MHNDCGNSQKTVILSTASDIELPEQMINRFQKLSVTLTIILSLCIVSVSACACSHHHENLAADKVSCHHDSAMAEMKTQSDAASDEHADTVSPSDECGCVQSAPRISAKNETLKIEKQTALIELTAPLSVKNAVAVVSFQTIEFAPSFYLFDSFCNLSPGRAPPRL